MDFTATNMLGGRIAGDSVVVARPVAIPVPGMVPNQEPPPGTAHAESATSIKVQMVDMNVRVVVVDIVEEGLEQDTLNARRVAEAEQGGLVDVIPIFLS